MPEERTEEVQDPFDTSAGMKPEEEKKEEGNQQPEWKEGDEVPPEIANHPAFKATSSKVSELSNNVKNQGAIIAEKDKKLREALKDKPVDEAKLPWKKADIRTSKDLTQDELDEMTDREIKLMDELAAVRRKENEAAEKKLREEMFEEAKQEQENEDKVKGDDLKQLIASEIGALSGGDAEKKRELEEAVKMLDLRGLTEDEVKARVKKAQSLIPNWTPPKEQQTGQGAPVKKGTADDPFGTKAIIDSASKGNDGNYAL